MSESPMIENHVIEHGALGDARNERNERDVYRSYPS
jgi:hypothetical protein